MSICLIYSSYCTLPFVRQYTIAFYQSHVVCVAGLLLSTAPSCARWRWTTATTWRSPAWACCGSATWRSTWSRPCRGRWCSCRTWWASHPSSTCRYSGGRPGTGNGWRGGWRWLHVWTVTGGFPGLVAWQNAFNFIQLLHLSTSLKNDYWCEGWTLLMFEAYLPSQDTRKLSSCWTATWCPGTECWYSGTTTARCPGKTIWCNTTVYCGRGCRECLETVYRTLATVEV